MLYSSKDNDKIKEIRKLKNKKYRDTYFLVEGKHLVEEAYKTKKLEKLILLEGENYKLDIETICVTKNVMETLTDMTSIPRMIGVCKKSEKKELGNHILMLDNIQDPGNLGTIIRSALAFDIDTIILSNNTVDLYNSKVIRSSQGMIFHINIFSTNLMEEIKLLKTKNYTIIGTKVDGGILLDTYKVPDKYVLIMGNEGNGVSKEISSLCDENIYISMNSECESLNVGVATSIILYNFRRQL